MALSEEIRAWYEALARGAHSIETDQLKIWADEAAVLEDIAKREIVRRGDCEARLEDAYGLLEAAKRHTLDVDRYNLGLSCIYLSESRPPHKGIRR